jgi:hypothetical protein
MEISRVHICITITSSRTLNQAQTLSQNAITTTTVHTFLGKIYYAMQDLNLSIMHICVSHMQLVLNVSC